MSLIASTLVRVKLDPLNPGNSMPMMKQMDEVKIHYDWALTHNLNWGLILTDHFSTYTGPLVRFKYEGAVLPITCHPDQRFGCPSRERSGGYRWMPIKQLQRGDLVYFVKAYVQTDRPITPVKITDYDVVGVENEMLYTLTVADELSFIAHDLMAHRNPKGYRAEHTTKTHDYLIGTGKAVGRIF